MLRSFGGYTYETLMEEDTELFRHMQIVAAGQQEMEVNDVDYYDHG